MEKAGGRLVGDQHGHQPQNDRAGESTEHAGLAGAETEARVVLVPPGPGVGYGGDQKGGHVGGHMEAVGHHGHGVEERAGDDFNHHHNGAKARHPAGAFFRRGTILKEPMLVLPMGNVVVMHRAPYRAYRALSALCGIYCLSFASRALATQGGTKASTVPPRRAISLMRLELR